MSGTSNSSPIDLDDFWRKASELGARSYAQRNLEEAKNYSICSMTCFPMV